MSEEGNREKKERTKFARAIHSYPVLGSQNLPAANPVEQVATLAPVMPATPEAAIPPVVTDPPTMPMVTEHVVTPVVTEIPVTPLSETFSVK